MLPLDRPIQNFALYEEYNFPLQTIPSDIPVNCKHMVHKTAAALSNEATKRASNSSVRMYCYNKLATNFWNNNDFLEVLSDTLWLINSEVSKGKYTSPELAFGDAVVNYLTLYTSMLTVTETVLRAAAGPRLLDASTQNYQVYMNTKLEIQHAKNQMYHNQMPMQQAYPMQQGQQQMPMQQGYPQQAPMVQQPMYPNQMSMHQGYPQQPMMPQQHMYPNQMQMPQSFPQQMPPQMPMGQAGSFMQQNNPIANMNGIASGGNSASSERFKNVKQKSYFEETVQQQPAAPIQYHQIQEPVVSNGFYRTDVKELCYKKGNEMDRSKHTITFMGNKYKMDNVVRSNNFAEQVSELVKVVAYDNNESLCVYQTPITDVCEDMLIMQGRGIHMARDSSKVLRCFGVSVNPIISFEVMEPFLDNIREAKNFNELNVKLQSLGAAFQVTSKDYENQDDKVAVFTAIDNRLTKLVNDFIKYELLLIDVFIDSFIEDYQDLLAVLKNSCQPSELTRLDNYGILATEQLFTDFSDAEKKEIRGILPADEYSSALYMPEKYSLTYLPVTDKELGYEIRDKIWAVSRGRTPILADILDSLKAHKKESQHETMHDLIITQDDVIYRVYTTDTGYLIRKN